MTEVTIPAVLVRLAQSGVSVRRRDDKAVFRAAAAPPSDIVALIEARKADISTFLCPEAVQRRLDAEAEVLQAPCPPDVSDDRWETALDGLRAFIAAGYGAEAERLGWPRDELYGVPRLWSQIHLCCAGLAVGDRTVTEITSEAIAILTSSGAVQRIYRKPAIDYGVMFEARLKHIRGNYADGAEEPRLRAIEHTVNAYRQNHPGVTIEEAKAEVLAAIKRSSTKETTAP